MLKIDGLYFVYLRKSRGDRDVEQHGEEETLARHKKILEELAHRYGITIAAWYREVVSGETIAARPEMLRMLDDIENLQPEGVLVVEIERLARGDTRDQGLIMETFKYSGTKIITPMKIYDPNDEFDEEYAEFGLFMSRREYKTINRRLQRGRKSSVSEGKWTGNKAPYGYERIKIPREKGYTLKIVPDQADTIKLIFQMYVHGTPETDNIPIGTSLICRKLDQLKIAGPESATWKPCTIRCMLENPVYIGKIRTGQRKQQKKTVNGVIRISRPINADVAVYEGLHAAIIDPDLFEKAQNKRKTSYKKPFFEGIKNPLAGLIYCAECGKSMYRRPAGARCPADMIHCSTRGCPTSGSYYSLVEEKLLFALNTWLEEYKIQVEDTSAEITMASLKRCQTQLELARSEELTLKNQLAKAMDLLERDVYTVEMFQQRATDLNEKITLSRGESSALSDQVKILESVTANREEVISRWERVLSEYQNVEPPAVKNTLLKEILKRVEYSKPHKGNRFTGGQDHFRLKIYPKL